MIAHAGDVPMQVIMTTHLAGPEIDLPAGEPYDCTDEEGQRLIDAGYAYDPNNLPAKKVPRSFALQAADDAAAAQLADEEATAAQAAADAKAAEDAAAAQAAVDAQAAEEAAAAQAAADAKAAEEAAAAQAAAAQAAADAKAAKDAASAAKA
jgi:hypothetical protein